MTYRRYQFRSFWDIDAPAETVWKVLTSAPFSWDEWWPELQNLQIITSPPGLSGTVFTCSWRSPVWYKLHTEVLVSEVKPLEFVKLQTTGDLRGWVKCWVKRSNNRTHVDIDWGVETVKPWMNRLHPILKPVFIQSHHAVMKSGELGLQQHLQKYKNSLK